MLKWKVCIRYKDSKGDIISDEIISESLDTLGKDEWRDIEDDNIIEVHITRVEG